jgi:hypothetical protein
MAGQAGLGQAALEGRHLSQVAGQRQRPVV